MPSTTPPSRLGKVTAIYRWTDGAHFDHQYYQTTHAKLALETLKPVGLLRFESEETVLSAPPAQGTIVAASNAYFASLADAQAALAKAGPALGADLPKYTNIRPTLHLSQVLVHTA